MRRFLIPKIMGCFGVLLMGCDKPSADMVAKSAKADKPLKPDVFKPLFEGDVSALAEALGDGPYKIGTPINGFPSENIKEAFDLYDYDLLFRDIQNTNSTVCDFTKVALFSDEIDLSQFYWHHSETEDDLLKKIDDHTYKLNDNSGDYLHISYGDYYLSPHETRGHAFSLIYPILKRCDREPSEVWPTSPAKVSELKHSVACKEYQETQTDFKLEFPGSDIGFFIYDGDLFVVSTYLYDSYAPNSPYSPSSIKIITYRVSYNNSSQSADLEKVCIFKRKQPD